jgi:hypothetical protein
MSMIYFVSYKQTVYEMIPGSGQESIYTTYSNTSEVKGGDDINSITQIKEMENILSERQFEYWKNVYPKTSSVSITILNYKPLRRELGD